MRRPAHNGAADFAVLIEAFDAAAAIDRRCRRRAGARADADAIYFEMILITADGMMMPRRRRRDFDAADYTMLARPGEPRCL